MSKAACALGAGGCGGPPRWAATAGISAQTTADNSANNQARVQVTLCTRSPRRMGGLYARSASVLSDGEVPELEVLARVRPGLHLRPDSNLRAKPRDGVRLNALEDQRDVRADAVDQLRTFFLVADHDSRRAIDIARIVDDLDRVA